MISPSLSSYTFEITLYFLTALSKLTNTLPVSESADKLLPNLELFIVSISIISSYFYSFSSSLTYFSFNFCRLFDALTSINLFDIFSAVYLKCVKNQLL